MKILFISLLVSLLVGCVLCAPASTCFDRSTVADFELSRFLGRWYEIARYDHSFERNLEAVYTDYLMRPDGKIEVVNRGINERTGEEKVVRGKAHTTDVVGRLRVSFFWFFYSDYNVLALGPDYEWALIGSRSPKYLWILARTPHLSAATIARILRLAEERGYPTAPLLFIDQPGDERYQATEQAIPNATT